MNQNEKVKELIIEVNKSGENNGMSEREMSFKSMLEQFYKRNFEPLPEPEAPPPQQSIVTAHLR